MNILFSFILYVAFAFIGTALFPLEDGVKMFTPATFIITGLLIQVLVTVYDVRDLLKKKE